ncbi:MAG: DUF721 domain-containing protein, partial [Pseudobdellovibrionaceae bacterium]
SPLSDQFVRWKLWAEWPHYVGPMIAENTEPVGLYHGVLYLWVKHSTWLHQLQFLKEQIQDSINSKLEKKLITGIRLTLDRREVPQAHSADEIRQQLQKLLPE